MGCRTPSVAGSLGAEQGPVGDELGLEYCKTMQIAGSTGGERCLEYTKAMQIAGSLGGERCLEYTKSLSAVSGARPPTGCQLPGQRVLPKTLFLKQAARGWGMGFTW